MKVYLKDSEEYRELNKLFPELNILIEKLKTYKKVNTKEEYNLLIDKIFPTILFNCSDSFKEIIVLLDNYVKDFIGFRKKILEENLKKKIL
jgi:hypothetical protein